MPGYASPGGVREYWLGNQGWPALSTLGSGSPESPHDGKWKRRSHVQVSAGGHRARAYDAFAEEVHSGSRFARDSHRTKRHVPADIHRRTADAGRRYAVI